MKSVKAILFDKDGTLFGYNATWGQWCDRVIARLAPDDVQLQQNLASVCGYVQDEDRFVAGSVVVAGTPQEIIDVWQAVVPGLQSSQIVAIAEEELNDLPLAPVCDLPIVLGRLRDMGYKLGVATNDFEATAKDQLASAGVTAYFDFIAGYDSGFGGKPAPGMILGFADHIGVAASQVLMVGDSTHDLQAGIAAGAACAAVLTGPAKAGDLAELANVVLDDISQLPAALEPK